jgi:hypothetical protein
MLLKMNSLDRSGRFVCAQHYCSRPNDQYIRARSQGMMPV